MAARRFRLSRGVAAGAIGRGSDLAQAPAVGLDGPEGEASAAVALRRAAERGEWLILFAHRVAPEPGEFAVHPQALARLADRAGALDLEVVTAAEGVRRLA